MSSEGLATEEARKLLQECGPNRLAERRRVSAISRLAFQFANPLIVVLLVAGVVTAAIGDYLDSGVIFAVVVINALIGWTQEGRAQRALDSVRALLVATATVIRNGHREVIDAADIVPGDLVVLAAGDRVPADIELHRCHAMRIEESILTGESVPVEKDVDRDPHTYGGTVVVSGSGMGQVIATGERTRMGQIGKLMEEADSLKTPLTKLLSKFSWQISAAIIAVGSLAWVFAVALRGYPPTEAFLAVVGLAVAAIPEGLPAIISIVLAIGTRAMARQRAIVRRLPAVETLGSVAAICTDKTGTLTRNEMTVVGLLLPHADLEVSGVGYTPEGEITADSHELSADFAAQVQDLVTVGALCNDAQLSERDGEWFIVGDPTEGALLPVAYKAQVDVEELLAEWELLDEIPFDPRNRYMATLRRHRDGRVRLFCKGAPEVILDLVSQSAPASTPDSASEWQDRINRAGQQGQRVLALAHADYPAHAHRITEEQISWNLKLVGMVTLLDPARPEALEAIRECQEAGIRVIMITGDHEVTAAAIARSLGLAADEAISGTAIEQAHDEELDELINRSDVIARASPEVKMRVIGALQGRGQSVAMTGDGVNDAPALRRADIGVAMGQRGTEAARDSSDVILTDDNFATIAAAVRQGRIVYDNIVKSLQFILPTNAGQAGLILVALGLGITLPVTVGQILWVNLVTTVTLALALGFEPGEADVMKRPPRPSTAGILNRAIIVRVLFVGALIVGLGLAAFEIQLQQGASLETARTTAATMIVLAQMAFLLNIRFLSTSSVTWRVFTGNRVALLALGALIIFQGLFIYLPLMQTAFETAPLSLDTWLWLAAMTLVFFFIVEAQKAWGRRERLGAWPPSSVSSA